MPNSVLWVCLVAIWLFVLVPMVIKGRPEVRRTTQATLATRVINRGGRAMSRASSRVARGRHPHDAEWVAPVREYRKPGELINADDDHADVRDDVDAEVHTEVDEDVDATEAAPEPLNALDERDLDDGVDEVGDDHEAGDADTDVDEVEDVEDVEDDYEVLAEPLATTEPVRRGRGGYDPTADTRRSETRYRSRQRILMVLATLAIASVAAGVVLGGRGWIITGAAGVLLVSYLFFLRRTVRIEERIRRQRATRAARAQQTMRRDRIDDEGPLRDEVPEYLRRPGAVVLEIDDEHPVFDHLPPFQRRRMMREEPEFRTAVGE